MLWEVEREGRAFLTRWFERLSPEQLSRLVESLEVLVAAAEEPSILAESDSPAS